MLGPVPAGPLMLLWALAQGAKRVAVTPPWPGQKPTPQPPPEPPPTPRRTASGDIVFPPPAPAPKPQQHATGLKEPKPPPGVPANARPVPGAPGVYAAPAYATPSGMKQTGPGSFEMPETYITAKQPTLRQGMTGENVKLVQQKLGQKMDGVFGPGTKGAVVAFQVQHHLTPDGVVGPATWNALLGTSSPAAAAPAANSVQLHPTSNAPATTLRQGAKGASVQLLQALLKTAGAPSLTVDSNFGPATLAAVKAFQQAHGLKPDGVVGPATWKALGY